MSTLSYRRASHQNNYAVIYFHTGIKKYGFISRIVTCCKESPSYTYCKLAIVEPLVCAHTAIAVDTITNATLPHMKAVLLDRYSCKISKFIVVCIIYYLLTLIQK